jgi:hypothetical protein
MIRGSRLSENKHWQQTEQLMKNRVFDIFILSYYNRQRVEDSVKAIICDCLQGKEEDTLIPKISEINDEITKLDVNYLRIYYQYKRDIKVDVDYFREAFISSTWRRDSSGNDPYINHGYPQIPELENIENNPVIEALLAESDFGYTPDGEIDIFESEIETDKYRHFKPFSPTIELLFKHCELFVLLRRKSLLKEELKKYRFKQSQDDFLVHRQSKETEKKTTDQPQIIVSEPNPTISETKKQKQTPIYGFKWTNDKTDTATFYNFLKPLIFWDKETDKETLDKIKMAFGGEEITVPLKIKWKIKINCCFNMLKL